MKHSNVGEYILETAKASPPVTVTVSMLAGVSLQEWVLWATLVYTLMQAGWFIYDKLIRRKRNGS